MVNPRSASPHSTERRSGTPLYCMGRSLDFVSVTSSTSHSLPLSSRTMAFGPHPAASRRRRVRSEIVVLVGSAVRFSNARRDASIAETLPLVVMVEPFSKVTTVWLYFLSYLTLRTLDAPRA